MIDYELNGSRHVSLTRRDFSEWQKEAVVVNCGMIMICRHGKAKIDVNFSSWTLSEGSVITLFPNDMVNIADATENFSAEVLEFSASLLREASLQMEQTVYSQLRTDRCRTESPTLTNIINCMFALLKIYFDQPNVSVSTSSCSCSSRHSLSGFTTISTATRRSGKRRMPVRGSGNCSTAS